MIELKLRPDVGYCGYFNNKIAKQPSVLLLKHISPERFDFFLAAGYRRYSEKVYTNDCPNCQDCIPIRLEVSRFELSKTQKRIWKNTGRLARVETGPQEFTKEKLALFNKHKVVRGLSSLNYNSESYKNWFNTENFDSFESRMYIDDKLVGVGILDEAKNSLSAVYTYFDPDYSKMSLGVFSVLSQIEITKKLNKKWLYLGFYIKENAHMNYKSHYLPHELLINGKWTLFERKKG